MKVNPASLESKPGLTAQSAALTALRAALAVQVHAARPSERSPRIELGASRQTSEMALRRLLQLRSRRCCRAGNCREPAVNHPVALGVEVMAVDARGVETVEAGRAAPAPRSRFTAVASTPMPARRTALRADDEIVGQRLDLRRRTRIAGDRLRVLAAVTASKREIPPLRVLPVGLQPGIVEVGVSTKSPPPSPGGR